MPKVLAYGSKKQGVSILDNVEELVNVIDSVYSDYEIKTDQDARVRYSRDWMNHHISFYFMTNSDQ